MVIEPAKGEYRHIFGNRKDVRVFGSNPEYFELLRINPFKFSKGIHILEHVDRLVEIFNVCWPMYAAMPAVLKEALLKAYEACGWDFSVSKNKYGENVYPTFSDLEESLIEVVNMSAYSEEVKSNYLGSLATRVKSLTNGLNGQIFTADEIDNNILFEDNVIIDLSRIGSIETKSLLMGILIMRLEEYRMMMADSINMELKHITVLEEAHNILRKASTEQNSEGSNLAGKSVEMISNAIAEMRTYGEGFVIVDQSPNAVDISAIRNTNTKIIMRLPDEMDRRLAGKSAGLRDDQLDEIAKLPKGVAVVYQNDWTEAVLCKIHKFEGNVTAYVYDKKVSYCERVTPKVKKNLIKLLLKKRVKNPIDIDIQLLSEDIEKAEFSTRNKLLMNTLLKEYTKKKELSLWKEEKFEALSEVISMIFDGKKWIRSLVEASSDFDMLTEKIMNEIKKQAEGISTEYAISAAQCIMRNETLQSEEYKVLYSAWITSLRNKGVF